MSALGQIEKCRLGSALSDMPAISDIDPK